MHHSNFLKATGHQCCLSALYWEYGTGGLQRTHSQAKNIPTSLYTLVDYSTITLIRSKGNYHFANQVSLLLIHKVSHATIILGHASRLQQQGLCTHTTLQGGCSSPVINSKHLLLLLFLQGQGFCIQAMVNLRQNQSDCQETEALPEPSGSRAGTFARDSACTEHFKPWAMPSVCHRHSTGAALCGCDSHCPRWSERETLHTHPHHEVPLETRHQSLSRSLNTCRNDMQQQAGDLQLDLGCA